MSLRAKRVVVVGGTSGIGFAIAEMALGEHAKVIVASSNQANVDSAVKRLAEGASGVALDVIDEAAVADVFEKLGKFDHLVFTAGDWNWRRGPLADLDLEQAKSNFTVRFWGALTVIKHAHKSISPGGSITLTDGMIAHRPSKGSAVSTAMAGGGERLTRGLAVELAPIRVNAVCPGLIHTGVGDSIPEERRPQPFEQNTKTQPPPRIGEPEETA